MTTETIEHTFSVRLPARLSLANIRGSVEIAAGEEGVIYILAKKHLESGEAEHTQLLIRQAEDGGVSAETRFEGVNWFSLPATKPCKVDYLIHTPRECNLQVNCVSSSLSIQGISGAMTISTVSGDLKLVDLAGSLQVKSVSGDISAEKISAQLALETVSGDVTLHVPAQTGFSIISQSISGNVVTTLPVTQRQKSFGETRVTIGAGGASIQHRSISGDLIIKDDGSADSPAPAVEQGIPDHMDILERIERGEMTVDEALHSLQPDPPLS